MFSMHDRRLSPPPSERRSTASSPQGEYIQSRALYGLGEERERVLTGLRILDLASKLQAICLRSMQRPEVSDMKLLTEYLGTLRASGSHHDMRHNLLVQLLEQTRKAFLLLSRQQRQEQLSAILARLEKITASVQSEQRHMYEQHLVAREQTMQSLTGAYGAGPDERYQGRQEVRVDDAEDAVVEREDDGPKFEIRDFTFDERLIGRQISKVEIEADAKESVHELMNAETEYWDDTEYIPAVYFTVEGVRGVVACVIHDSDGRSKDMLWKHIVNLDAPEGEALGRVVEFSAYDRQPDTYESGFAGSDWGTHVKTERGTIEFGLDSRSDGHYPQGYCHVEKNAGLQTLKAW